MIASATAAMEVYTEEGHQPSSKRARSGPVAPPGVEPSKVAPKPSATDHDLELVERIVQTQLNPASLRRLLLGSWRAQPLLLEKMSNAFWSEVALSRENRRLQLVRRLNRPFINQIVTTYLEEFEKVSGSGSTAAARQHEMVEEFCRMLEPYMFMARELGCDIQAHYALAIQVLCIIVKGAQQLCEVPAALDVAETMRDWAPSSSHTPPSFSRARGFIACLYRLWSHVLHTAVRDEHCRSQPRKLQKLFRWSIREDPAGQLREHLLHLDKECETDRNLGLELYLELQKEA